MDNAILLQKFEQHLRRRYPGRSTALHYVSDVKQFQKTCTKPWADITRADVDTFLEAGQQRGWKPATLQRRVAALKVFFDFCADETGDLERANPVELKRHAPKRAERLPRDVGDETLEKLWLVLDEPRDQVWFTLMLRAGLRVGEVVTLTRRDVLAAATETTPARLRVLGKGQKERIVYLSGDAWAVVARWLAERPADPASPLCPNRRGQAMTVNGLQERLRHYAAKAGVTVRCHQLRHTFARQMVEHEMPVTSLSKMLGHDSLTTTQVYLAGADPALRETYQRAMQAWETESPAAPPAQPVAASFPVIASPALPDARAWPTFTEWATDLPAWVRDPCREYVQRAMRDWKASQRQRQGRRRLQALAQFWRWQLQQRDISAWGELTRADLQAFGDAQLARGCGPSTVTNTLYPLWGVLRLRAEQGETIAPNVFRLTLPKDPEPAPRHLGDAEAAALERQVRAIMTQDTPECRRDAACYYVLAHTGIRLNELLDLRRGDVDWPGQRLRIVEGKGLKDRVVYLSDLATQALARYLELRRPDEPLATPLLCHVDGHPLSYRWVQKRIHDLGEEAGVPNVSPHRLRHTLATCLLNQGVPITSIQKLLGHRDLSTTQRYARVADATAEADYRRAMAQAETPLTLAPIPIDALVGHALSRETVPTNSPVTLDNSL